MKALVYLFVAVSLMACSLTPTSSPHSQPSPSPSPSPIIKANIVKYRTMVSNQTVLFSNALNVVSSSCSSSLPKAPCVKALRDLSIVSANYRAALDANPAPPCLMAFDAKMRSALDMYVTGTTLEANGFESNDFSAIAKGSGQVASATTDLKAGIDLANQSNC